MACEVAGIDRAYCEQRGLAVCSLDYWRRRLSSGPEAGAEVLGFVPLQVRSVEPPAETLLLECAGGARLRLPRDVSGNPAAFCSWVGR